MNKFNKTRAFLLCALSGLLITACSNNEDVKAPAAETPADDGFKSAYHSFDTDALKADIKTLSSDAFGGREPATAGGKMTTDLLVKEFKALGLQPGNGDSYLQSVPLVSIVSEPQSDLTIGDIKFDYLKNFVANSRQTKDQVELNNSELVFVGYGVNAPEYNWNDYEGIDVKGKTFHLDAK